MSDDPENLAGLLRAKHGATVDQRRRAEVPRGPTVDGRRARATGRNVQLNLKVTPEFKARLVAAAERRKMLLVEVLETAFQDWIAGK